MILVLGLSQGRNLWSTIGGWRTNQRRKGVHAVFALNAIISMLLPFYGSCHHFKGATVKKINYIKQKKIQFYKTRAEQVSDLRICMQGVHLLEETYYDLDICNSVIRAHSGECCRRPRCPDRSPQATGQVHGLGYPWPARSLTRLCLLPNLMAETWGYIASAPLSPSLNFHQSINPTSLLVDLLPRIHL